MGRFIEDFGRIIGRMEKDRLLHQMAELEKEFGKMGS